MLLEDVRKIDIDLSQVSPSGVGDYAVCTLKLLLDSMFPEEDKDDKYAPNKCFGTVCHYHSQVDLGARPVPEKYSTEEWETARRLKGTPATEKGFIGRVDKCAKKANSVVNRVSPLADGDFWHSERKVYDKLILPRRLNRKGVLSGYGGSVDLLLSSETMLWDYKFTSRLPTAYDVDKIKTVYLWQLGSYHIVSGVPKTGIVWTTTTGAQAAYLVIDWEDEHMQFLADCIRRFLRFVDDKAFVDYAWPVRGESCFFCDHKARCPLYRIPPIVDTSLHPVDDGPETCGDLSHLLDVAGGADPTPPPPPVPAPAAEKRQEAVPPTPPPPPVPKPAASDTSDWSLF